MGTIYGISKVWVGRVDEQGVGSVMRSDINVRRQSRVQESVQGPRQVIGLANSINTHAIWVCRSTTQGILRCESAVLCWVLPCHWTTVNNDTR